MALQRRQEASAVVAHEGGAEEGTLGSEAEVAAGLAEAAALERLFVQPLDDPPHQGRRTVELDPQVAAEGPAPRGRPAIWLASKVPSQEGLRLSAKLKTEKQKDEQASRELKDAGSCLFSSFEAALRA